MGWENLSGLMKGGIIGAVIGFILGVARVIVGYPLSTCPAGMACAVDPITKINTAIIVGVVLAILGFLLGTIVAAIIQFFFGSSMGSKEKDKLFSKYK